MFYVLYMDVGLHIAKFVALLPCNKNDMGSVLAFAFSQWNLHVLPVYLWLHSMYSDFLP